jgi:hypothetical protein
MVNKDHPTLLMLPKLHHNYKVGIDITQSTDISTQRAVDTKGRDIMDVSKILAEIDAKIESLQQARAAILSLDEGTAGKAKRGRPKGSVNTAKPVVAKKKRNLSPEGRKRIADAMKRRWAAQRKETAKAK